jgi:hypothetical protein
VIVAQQHLQLPTSTIATPALGLAAVRGMIRRLYADVATAAKLESVLGDVGPAREALTMYARTAMALLTELRRTETSVAKKGV